MKLFEQLVKLFIYAFVGYALHHFRTQTRGYGVRDDIGLRWWHVIPLCVNTPLQVCNAETLHLPFSSPLARSATFITLNHVLRVRAKE